jgi:hypothetical protein
MRTAPAVATGAAAAIAFALCGCGAVSGPDIEFPTIPAATASAAPPGDSATFSVDGQTTLVQQSGSISARNPGVPEFNYTGPLGCRGRFFTAHLTEHIRILFRYTRGGEAYMLIGTGDLYRFPRHRGRALLWDKRFEDGRRIRVVVRCAA